MLGTLILYDMYSLKAIDFPSLSLSLSPLFLGVLFSFELYDAFSYIFVILNL